MDALFNSLERGRSYEFQLAHHAFTRLVGVFHGINPDGTLLVAHDGDTSIVNPAQIVSARHMRTNV